MIPQPRSVVSADGRLDLTGLPFDGPENIAQLLAEHGLPVAGRWSIVDDVPREGYRLHADQELLVDGDELGLIWAVQTLRWLTVDGSVPCGQITDSPDYAWRGSLLDVARWCLPIEFLFQYVDLLALHKLNRLHLHLTDDQGWRFEVKRYPLLTSVGGFRAESTAGHFLEERTDGVPHGGFYSQEQLRDLVAFGRRRGVEIMPEIDLPGHTQAAISAYPHLGPGQSVGVSTRWGIHDIVLNSEPETLEFFKHVLDEVVDVFPFTHVHLGGDEVRGMENAQLGWWIAQMQDHLHSRGRQAAVWDELLDADPPKGLLFFGWQDDTKAPAAREAGFEAVTCPVNHAYLDWSESDRDDEPLAIAGFLPLEQVYRLEPGDVTGVQGNVWTEYLPTPELVQWRAFPRLGALAEIGWHKQDYASFLARLPEYERLLRTLGVSYRPR